MYESKTGREISLAAVVAGFPVNKSTILNVHDVVGISIQDFCIEIKGQNIDEFPDEWRIYYGEAWFNKRAGGKGYFIRFYNQLSTGGFSRNPTAFIGHKDIETSVNDRFTPETMDRLATNKPKQVFILSKKAPYINGGFINIHCEGAGDIDYKELYIE